MDDFSQSVAVMLLPTWDAWSTLKLPHVTLVYAGEIPDLSNTVRGELMKEAQRISVQTSIQVLDVTGTDVFGDEHKVDVLKFAKTPALVRARLRLARFDASEYPWSPHGTVGPEGSLDKVLYTNRVTFDRIAVGWGADRTVYRLLS